jgi:hypothetical protein
VSRRKAPEKNTSVSKPIVPMLERRMTFTDAYWRAFQRWKSRQTIACESAAERMSREQTHERT